MSLRDVALCALTYPDATPEAALEAGVALASRLGGAFTLMTLAVRVPAPTGALASIALGGAAWSDAESSQSRATAQQLGDIAAAAAARLDRRLTHEALTCVLLEEAPMLCHQARTRDVVLMPVGEAVVASRSIAETVIVDGGRPVLIYPETWSGGADPGFRSMAIAWDGSASAARAVGSALPALRTAEHVRIVLIGEASQHGDPEALSAHLSRHGVATRIDRWPKAGRSVGRALGDYQTREAVDLLIMGGFGHGRLREGLLGGATRDVIDAPAGPVWIAH